MSHIEVIALRPFHYSENGYTELQAVENSTFLLPDTLFDGLNKAGYVRRATIGDGHFELTPPSAQDSGTTPASEAPVVEAVEVTPAAAVDVGAVNSADNTPPEVVGAVITTGVIAPAPQPPARTAELTDGEKAGLADGSWKDWRFFKRRSVAAKVSSNPILTGEDAKAAIEAHIAAQE